MCVFVSLLLHRYQKLIEKQRRYFKAVKEFQEECDRNEKLSDMLEQRTGGD